MPRKLSTVAIVLMALVSVVARADDGLPRLVTFRLSDGGVQPQAAVDEKGTVHLIYLAGDPAHSDIFSIHSTDGGVTWSRPVRVNSQPGSALAIGTVRGAHLALGRGGRLHVAWMGSSLAQPKAPGKSTPMLYTRSTDDDQAFEPQRNVVQSKAGLDGGGSVAADAKGNVTVAWHAPESEGAGEQSRKVWLSRSEDDGKTFAPERPATTQGGACGCCGLRLFASPDGPLYALYRSADQKIHRDMTLLRIDPKTDAADAKVVGPMESAVCVMSTAAFAPSPGGGVTGAWETDGQIYWAAAGALEKNEKGVKASKNGKGQKHPAIAINGRGETLIVWTEGTGWNRGGSVAWQIFGKDGSAIPKGSGRADSLPTWGAPAAFARPDGTFVVAY
jgi:hypothetical protein